MAKFYNKFHKEKIVIYKNQIVTKFKNIWSNKWGKFLIIILVFSLIGHILPKSKIDIYDPKNRFYYDDKFRIMPVAVWLSCGQSAMGKSTWLRYSDEVIVPCDPKYSNCAVLGPQIKLCLFGEQ